MKEAHLCGKALQVNKSGSLNCPLLSFDSVVRSNGFQWYSTIKEKNKKSFCFAESMLLAADLVVYVLELSHDLAFFYSFTYNWSVKFAIFRTGLFLSLYILSSLLNSLFVIVQALFWQQQNYYGVNLTPLHGTAFQGYFSQVWYKLVFRNLMKVIIY